MKKENKNANAERAKVSADKSNNTETTQTANASEIADGAARVAFCDIDRVRYVPHGAHAIVQVRAANTWHLLQHVDGAPENLNMDAKTEYMNISRAVILACAIMDARGIEKGDGVKKALLDARTSIENAKKERAAKDEKTYKEGRAAFVANGETETARKWSSLRARVARSRVDPALNGSERRAAIESTIADMIADE